MSKTTSTNLRKELAENVLANDESSIVVNPSENLIHGFVHHLTNDDNSNHVRMSVNEDTIKSVVSNFIVGAKASDLIENNKLEIRTTSHEINGTIIATGGDIYCVADLNEPSVISPRQDYTDDIESTVESIWDGSNSFNIRTPSFTRIYSTMEEELGSEFVEDYRNIINHIENSEEDDMDEVVAALLVGAKNKELLYDVSKWGEDCGLASKATFSRTKSRIESEGYLETEKVPIDIGRPRLRLKLASNVFEEEYDGLVVSAIQTMI